MGEVRSMRTLGWMLQEDVHWGGGWGWGTWNDLEGQLNWTKLRTMAWTQILFPWL